MTPSWDAVGVSPRLDFKGQAGLITGAASGMGLATARAFAVLWLCSAGSTFVTGHEKHADLPQALPTNASRPGTIRNGDLMLYGSNTLVVFYLTFDSSYSCTRLGRVDEPADLAQALDRRSVRIVFSKD